MDNKDFGIQVKASAFARKLGRRNFLVKATGTVAGLLASAVIGKVEGTESAFASTYACYPPNGTYCSGCSSTSACPSSHYTCTTSNDICGSGGQCVYSTGWWYTSGSVGNRHRCRDCQKYGPIVCHPANQCGCRSTVHY